MKLKSILMATMFASAGFMAVAAHAAPIVREMPTELVSDDEGGFNAHFGNNFGSATSGKSFADKYFFSITSGFDSSASLTSTYLNSTKVKDLMITGFSLTKYDPSSLVNLMTVNGVNETSAGTNPTDSWSLKSFGLTSGSYFIKVDGNIIGNGGGTYGSDLTISAVPEPETYGMLLAGLGLMGFVARRKAKKAASV